MNVEKIFKIIPIVLGILLFIAQPTVAIVLFTHALVATVIIAIIYFLYTAIKGIFSGGKDTDSNASGEATTLDFSREKSKGTGVSAYNENKSAQPAGYVTVGNVKSPEYKGLKVTRRYSEDYCLRILSEGLAKNNFSKCAEIAADDIKFFIPEKSREPIYYGKTQVFQWLHRAGETAAKDGENTYTHLGKIDGYYGNDPNAGRFVGRKAIIISYLGPAWLRCVMCIGVNAIGEITEIIFRDIFDYSVSVEEEKHYYPMEYLYLNLLKEGLDSGDCSRLINYLSYDARYEDYTGEQSKGCYNTLVSLDMPFKSAKSKNAEIKTFLFKVSEGPDKDKIGIGLSLNRFEECEFAYFIKIKDGKISLIELLENNYAMVELTPMPEICKHWKENTVLGGHGVRTQNSSANIDAHDEYEEQALRILYDAFLSKNFSTVRKILAEDLEYIVCNRDNVRTISGKDVGIMRLLDICGMMEQGADDKAFIRSIHLGVIDACYTGGSNYAGSKGKHVLVQIYGRPMFGIKIMSLKITPAGKIGKIILEETVGHYSISIEEDKHYDPNVYIYLNLIKEAMDSLDPSRIINYFAHDIVFEYIGVSGGIKSVKGWDLVFNRFDVWLESIRNGKVINNTFLFKVCEGPDEGKIGIGVSTSSVDKCWAVWLIEIKGGAKISSLKFLENCYVMQQVPPLPEICKHHKEIPTREKIETAVTTERMPKTTKYDNAAKQYRSPLQKVKTQSVEDAIEYLKYIIYDTIPDFCLYYDESYDDAFRVVYLEHVMYKLDPDVHFEYYEIDKDYIEYLDDIIYNLNPDVYTGDVDGGNSHTIIYHKGIIAHFAPDFEIEDPDDTDSIKIICLENIIADLDPDFEIDYPEEDDESKLDYLENVIYDLDPDADTGPLYGDYDEAKAYYLADKLDSLAPALRRDWSDYVDEGIIVYLQNLIYTFAPSRDSTLSDAVIEKAKRERAEACDTIVAYHLRRIRYQIKSQTKKYLADFAEKYYNPPKFKGAITYNLLDEEIYGESLDFNDSSYFNSDSTSIVLYVYDGKQSWTKEDKLKEVLTQQLTSDIKLFATINKNIKKYKRVLKRKRRPRKNTPGAKNS